MSELQNLQCGFPREPAPSIPHLLHLTLGLALGFCCFYSAHAVELNVLSNPLHSQPTLAKWSDRKISLPMKRVSAAPGMRRQPKLPVSAPAPEAGSLLLSGVPTRPSTWIASLVLLPLLGLAAALARAKLGNVRIPLVPAEKDELSVLDIPLGPHPPSYAFVAAAAAGEDDGAAKAVASAKPLDGMVIACAGTFTQKQAELQAFLQKHGAMVSSEVDAQVTHLLLSRRGGSRGQKHIAALKLKIPCISEDWIRTRIASATPEAAAVATPIPPGAAPAPNPSPTTAGHAEPAVPTPAKPTPKPRPGPVDRPLWDSMSVTRAEKVAFEKFATELAQSVAAKSKPATPATPAAPTSATAPAAPSPPPAAPPAAVDPPPTPKDAARQMPVSVRELLLERAYASQGRAFAQAKAQAAELRRKAAAGSGPQWKAVPPREKRRDMDAQFPSPPPPPEPHSPEAEQEVEDFDLEEELKHVVGLADVKQAIRGIATTLKAHQRRVARGLTPPDMSMMCHMLFIGSSGTGKTMVARLVARLLKHIGLLARGHLVEVAAKDLIAGHCGQTAPKTSAACHRAHGGVLFIDEAYSINPRGDSPFGRECVDTLVKEMEDHREKFVVMMAGYPESMRVFLDTNEGLKSRFNERFTFYFNDYSTGELASIFQSELAKRHYLLAGLLEPQLPALIERCTTPETRKSQNGRLMRTLVENCIANQNGRWVDLPDDEVTDEMMVTIAEADFQPTAGGPLRPATAAQRNYVPGLSPDVNTAAPGAGGYFISGSGVAYYPGYGPIGGGPGSPKNPANGTPTDRPRGFTIDGPAE